MMVDAKMNPAKSTSSFSPSSEVRMNRFSKHRNKNKSTSPPKTAIAIANAG